MTFRGKERKKRPVGAALEPEFIGLDIYKEKIVTVKRKKGSGKRKIGDH
ncbi:hypothetical protein [Veronia pacifica]